MPPAIALGNCVIKHSVWCPKDSIRLTYAFILFLNRLGKEAAVHADVCAGDEAAGFVAGEEDGGADEFFGFAEALHGGVAEDGLGARGGGAVFVEEEGAILFGRKEARGDGVDADTFGGPFAGKELGEVEDGGFGGGVGYDSRKGEVGGYTGDVDDRPASIGQHARPENLAGEEDAADEVEIEIGAPIFDGDLFEFFVGGDGDFGIVAAGGVDEDSGGAETV